MNSAQKLSFHAFKLFNLNDLSDNIGFNNFGFAQKDAYNRRTTILIMISSQIYTPFLQDTLKFALMSLEFIHCLDTSDI